MEQTGHVRHRARHAPASPTKAPRRRDGHAGELDELNDDLRSLRDALRAAAQGDLSIRLPADGKGLPAEVAAAFNALVERNEGLVTELDRVAQAVAVRGSISERAALGPVGGSWARAVESVNTLVDTVAWPTLETTRVLRSLAAGDLSHSMSLHVAGRPIQGELAGLVDDVNALATNLTDQVRNIALVSSAIAKGDLSQRVTVETRGEILELKNAVNSTVDQLRSFSAEVIRVAREVGTEGQLGAQADVRGVSGVWQELTDSVNRLAGNLTSQVRNIAAISTAIANGDLSQKITVEAKGEILELKNTVNTMVELPYAPPSPASTTAHEAAPVR